jgi:CheY-like chemotaxis protein
VSNNKNEIIPRGSPTLSKYGSSLVGRGLHELTKSVSKKGRVLLVDDEEVIIEVVERMLVANGYEVRTTCRALDAIALAKNFQPQVALLGMVMPFMDGLKLGRELSTFLPKTKIVLWIEVYGLGSDFLEVVNRQGYNFALFPVPFEKEELLKKLDSWLYDSANIDSVTGFGLENHFSFCVALQIHLNEGVGIPQERMDSAVDDDVPGAGQDEEFSIVLFEIVEHWPERNPPPERRRKLFGELAHRIRQTVELQLKHALFDLFRLTEDRFAVLLPQDDRDSARELTGGLRNLIYDTEWREDVGYPVKLSAEFAVVSFPKDGRTEQQVTDKGLSLLSDMVNVGGPGKDS